MMQQMGKNFRILYHLKEPRMHRDVDDILGSELPEKAKNLKIMDFEKQLWNDTCGT